MRHSQCRTNSVFYFKTKNLHFLPKISLRKTYFCGGKYPTLLPCFFIMHILILGAGKSSLYLIQYLLQAAAEAQWRITVGDLSLEQAAAKINAHPCGEAVVFDIHNEEHRREYVSQADIVVSLLPATLHTLVAGECLKHGAHLVTASYITAEAAALDEAFRAAGLLFMGELGLDPGIDHLAIMELLHRLRGQGAQLHAVQSHTGALIAPESDTNPWHYKFSWAPMNVVLAGQGVSRYLYEGAIKYLPYRRLFENYWVRPIAGIGDMEIYANRNSLDYVRLYGLDGIATLLRGTIRYRGYCDAWNAIVQLGLADNTFKTDTAALTYGAFTASFVPEQYSSIYPLKKAVAQLLAIAPDSEVMRQLEWLGLFSEERVPLQQAATPAEIMCDLLLRKWQLQPHDRDMVVMLHEIEYTLEGKRRRLLSSLLVKGEDEAHTAIAKTVGLPAAMLVKRLAQGNITLRGVHIPVQEEVYLPVLEELKQHGIAFVEQEEEVEGI